MPPFPLKWSVCSFPETSHRTEVGSIQLVFEFLKKRLWHDAGVCRGIAKNQLALANLLQKNDVTVGIFQCKMPTMFTRLMKAPDRSFFLFGPRGTGKTTWLHATFPQAIWFDLLDTSLYLALSKNPGQLRQKVDALDKNSWVIIDEIQKMPHLLDEVHRLHLQRSRDIKFAISGSSARKLKRLGSNLLAGRTLNRSFFPLTGAELNYDFDVSSLLKYGCLPAVRDDMEFAVDILEAYATNYIREEIQQEALVKDTPSFTRFLEVAAIMNGQIVNITGISRDAGVARQTVQRYFETLIGTLVGFWLPAWRPKIKVREQSHPKFYFFDTGVVRTLSGRLRSGLDSSERGPLMETLILHELRAWMAMANTGGQLFYWRSPAGVEVDVVWIRGDDRMAFEIKSASQWKSEYGSVLKELLAQKIVKKAYGLYDGTDELRDGPLTIFPIKMFMRKLQSGDIFH